MSEDLFPLHSFGSPSIGKLQTIACERFPAEHVFALVQPRVFAILLSDIRAAGGYWTREGVVTEPWVISLPTGLVILPSVGAKAPITFCRGSELRITPHPEAKTVTPEGVVFP